VATLQEQLNAIDAATGGTASAPLTAEQQQIRTLSQTQAIPASTISDKPPSAQNNAVPVYSVNQINTSIPVATVPNTSTGTVGNDSAKANQQVGVGAANDDKGTSNAYIPSASTTSAVVTPAPNALDQYASYTYSLSWYLLTPEQGKAVEEKGKLSTNEWTLLMQSGGAPIKERSKYFAVDYYMDNLEIETTYVEDTIAAVESLNFTVTEPNGITLIANLNKAARELYKQDVSGLADKAFYVMVIRFYGWDANGNMITKTSPAAGAPGAVNNTNAAVVKFYPFVITSLTFTAASKAVEYRIKGAALGIKYAMSQALGSVPHPIELVGETVNDVLNGSVSVVKVKDDSKRQTTASVPPTASVNDIRTSAGVNENGNFTGETASPFQAGA
jgi:hypothetical protein